MSRPAPVDPGAGVPPRAQADPRDGPARRIALLLLVALGLSPGLWWRTRVADDDRGTPIVVAIESLQLAPEQERIGPFRIDGAWALTSDHAAFGGYSAIVAVPGGLLLASDRGQLLLLDPPAGIDGGVGGHRRRRPPVQAPLLRHAGLDWRYPDVEAVARDPATGQLWFGIESKNAVVRTDAALGRPVAARPPAMRGWAANGGPETLLRMADGRFLVIEEGAWFGTSSTLLLFPGDPVDSGSTGREQPLRATLAHPAGWLPVDAEQWPDGRVLVLLRRFVPGLPPHYRSALAMIDLIGLQAGQEVAPRIVAQIAAPSPSDNYEGMAIVPRPDGSVTLWLVSDDNRAVSQRTLLLELGWRAEG